MAQTNHKRLGDDEIRRLITGQDPVHDPRIGGIQGELRLGQLNCFRKMDDPLSQTMAREIRDECRFETFDRVMESLVRDGMRPLNEEDMGVFVSWLILNLPYERQAGETVQFAKARMASDHESACTKMGCWHFAASRDAEPEVKVKVGRAMRRATDAFLRGAYREFPAVLLDTFGGIAGGIEGQKVIAQPLTAEFEIYQPDDDRSYLTNEAIEVARRPGAVDPKDGWYREPGTLKSVDTTRLEGSSLAYLPFERHMTDRMVRSAGYVRDTFLEVSVADMEVALNPVASSGSAPVAGETHKTTIIKTNAERPRPKVSVAERLRALDARFSSAEGSAISNLMSDCVWLESVGRHRELAEGLMGVIESQLGIELPESTKRTVKLENRIIRAGTQGLKIGRQDVSRLIAESLLRLEKPNGTESAVESLVDAVEALSKPT